MKGILRSREHARVADIVMNTSKADQVEAAVETADTYLTRFANSEIHQNTGEHTTEVVVRSVFGQRVGVASTTSLDREAIEATVRRAEQIALLQPENPGFPGLPDPAQYGAVEAYSEETAMCTPEQRAAGVGEICRLAVKEGLVASGSFSTTAREVMVVNSRGLLAEVRFTRANLLTVVMSSTGSGYAERFSVDVADIDSRQVAEEAVKGCLADSEPGSVEPGEYEAIFEDYAVADMIQMLAYMGFGARAFQEGRSFMSGNIGRKITGANITIWDDGLDPGGAPLPFDAEGVPKKKVMLIEDGVARGVVYDSFTAAREGKRSTGHAVSPLPSVGPFAVNLFMAGGDSCLDEMIAETRRGIYVKRLHYTNPVHPVKSLLTGMTRDGTFLVENGEIVRPVKNLRFTESILGALSSAELISKETKLLPLYSLGGVRAPAVKVGKFTFTGVTGY
ncbi:MAG: TldD/PmbA family protein [Firmicutes bacterium]|nr:TldD/PmbA family protein [Bacillota bacterium]MDH7494559.1 TldD/PmbA family protein [Bacillota bacterium]